jgi:hypothetical protein
MRWILGSCLAALVSAAHAQTVPHSCGEVEAIKTDLGDKGRWTVLTGDQWQFLRGISVLNPNSPNGLPYGDKAALLQVPDHEGAMVVFLDGARACDAMLLPPPVVTMLMRVGAGDVEHEPLEGVPQ